MPQLSVRVERFPIAGTFTIARGSKTEAVVVVARLEADGRAGEGECVPYARYGETVEGTVKTLEELAKAVSYGLDRTTLQAAFPPVPPETHSTAPSGISRPRRTALLSRAASASSRPPPW